MKLRKKVVLAGVVTVAAIGIGTAAFAIIKTNGTGSGAATVATNVVGVDLSSAPLTVSNIVPGVPVPISVLTKNTNGFTATIGAISGTVTTVDTGVVGVDNTVCEFEIVAEAPGTTHAVPSSASFQPLAGTTVALRLKENAQDQTPCLSATVNFDLTA